MAKKKAKAEAQEQPAGGALAAFSATLPTLDPATAANALIQGADEVSSGAGDGRTYLSYSGKKSKWSIGRDNEEPDEDAVYIVDPRMATSGFKCWKDSKPVATHQWSLLYGADKAVGASDLADHGPYKNEGDGWQAMLGISMFDIDAPDQHIEFTTTSVSGRNTLGDLMREAGQLWADEASEFPPMAVLQLTDEQFQAHGQWNGKPTFEILGWVPVAEAEAFIADEEGELDDLLAGDYAGDGEAEVEDAEVVEEEPAPKPTKRRRRKAA